jgi:hypothetical protein
MHKKAGGLLLRQLIAKIQPSVNGQGMDFTLVWSVSTFSVAAEKPALVTSNAGRNVWERRLRPWFSARARKTAPEAGTLPALKMRAPGQGDFHFAQSGLNR